MVLATSAFAVRGFDHEHRALDALLQTHVTDGRVDYRGLQRDRGRLDAYLAELSAPKADGFDAWTADQRLAYWLNAYNAFVLATVAEHYPIEGRTLVGLAFPSGSVWQIKGVWKKIKHRVAGGREVSLHQIENDIIRERFDEPRIHFALVCASLGCPALSLAFRASMLDAQLEEQTRRFLDDPNKGVRVDGDTVHISKIFKWFDEDFESFAGSDPCFADLKRRHAGALSFIARYRTEISKLDCDSVRVKYLDYDWHLNARPVGSDPRNLLN